MFLLDLREVIAERLQDAFELGGLRAPCVGLFLVQLREAFGGDEFFVEVRLGLCGGFAGAAEFLVGARRRRGCPGRFFLRAAQVPDGTRAVLLELLELVRRRQRIRRRRLPRREQFVGFFRELGSEPLVVLLQQILLLLHPRLGALEGGLFVVSLAELRLDAAALLLRGYEFGEVILRGFVALGNLVVLELDALRQLAPGRVRLVQLSLRHGGTVCGVFCGQLNGFPGGVWSTPG